MKAKGIEEGLVPPSMPFAFMPNDTYAQCLYALMPIFDQ
jgi:hypothetical protein